MISVICRRYKFIISTSGLDGHTAISGCLSITYLFLDTFFEFVVVANLFFLFAVELQKYLPKIYSVVRSTMGFRSLDDDLLLFPVLSVILKMQKYRCLYSCIVILPLSNAIHVCEVYNVVL